MKYTMPYNKTFDTKYIAMPVPATGVLTSSSVHPSEGNKDFRSSISVIPFYIVSISAQIILHKRKGSSIGIEVR